MQNIFSGNVFNVFKFICANGPGETAGGGTVNLMSGLMTLLTAILDLLSSLVSWVWGLLMTVLYNVVKLVLNIVDVLEFFVTKLVGIDIYKEPGWSNTTSLKDSDMIIKLITSETVLNLFGKICIIGGLLLIIFCIFSIVKENYQIAMGDEVKGNPATNALKKAVKSIFLCILVPFLLIVGILGSNVILASVCAAIRGNNDLTIGGVIFTTSAYEANRYRLYAKEGMRTPIYFATASQIVNPSDYATNEDMMMLFLDLAVGDIYIGSLSPDIQKNIENGKYDDWYNEFKSLDLKAVTEYDYNDGSVGDTFLGIGTGILQVGGKVLLGSVWETITGAIDKISDAGDDFGDSSAAAAFNRDFKTWYDKEFKSTPLDDLSLWDKHIRSIYNTNWNRNDGLSDNQVEFSSSYEKSQTLNFTNQQEIYVFSNTEAYSKYENFTTTEVEYYVMADLMDYAIEHNQKFYFVNANNDKIQWQPQSFKDKNDLSKGEIDPDKAIETYSATANVFKYTENNQTRYVVADGLALSEAGITTNKDGKYEYYGKNATKIADDSFYVSYSGGGNEIINRLYWSETDSLGERYGSTYIVCIAEKDGNGEETGLFLPVTQKTTNFRSSFLADNYSGPIIARGAFSSWGIVSLTSKQYPTGLREQLVDANGVPIKTIESKNDEDKAYSINTVVSTNSENELITTNYFRKVVGETTEGSLIGDIIASATAEGVNTSGLNVISEQIKNLPHGSNLYYNTNIKYYKIIATNKIEFYDSALNRMRLAKGKSSEIECSDNISDVTAYYVVDSATKYNYTIVSDNGLSQEEIREIIKGETEDKADWVNISTDDDLIVITYKGKRATFKYNGEEISMIVGLKADGIKQGLAGNDLQYGTFYELEHYINLAGFGEFKDFAKGDYVARSEGSQVAIYKKNPINLYIKNGEVYTSQGAVYCGLKQASELKDSVVSDLNKITAEDLTNYLFKKGSNEQLNLLSYTILEVYEGGKLKIEDGEYKKVDSDISYKVCNGYVSETKSGASGGATIERKGGLYTLNGKNFIPLEGNADFSDNLNNKTIYFLQDCSEIDDADQKKKTLMLQAKENIINCLANAGTSTGDLEEQQTAAVTGLYNNVVSVQYIMDKIIISVGSAVEEVPTSRYAVKDKDKVINYVTSTGETNDKFEFFAIDKNVTATIPITAYLQYDIVGEGDNKTQSNHKLLLTEPTTIENVNESQEVKINVVVRYDKYSDGSGKSRAVNFAVAGVEFDGEVPNELRVYGSSISCKGLVALSQSAITQIAAIELQKTVDVMSSLNLKNVATDGDRYVYFEYGTFGVLFSNIILDFSLHFDLSNIINGQGIFSFRCRPGFVKSYSIKTSYHLDNGGFILDYNFNRSTGIGITYLFDMRNINPLVLIFSTAIVFNMLWKMVWGLIARIYEIAIQFIILPGVLSVDVLTPGKFKDWSGNIIKKVMLAYSSLIMINLYYALIPSINSLTEGLIVWDDLPSTITSWLGCIGNSVSNIGGGKLMGNINLSSILTILPTIAAGYTGKTIAGFLNKIIFILFFLVLTTLTSKGKDLIGDYINSGDIVKEGESVKSDVSGLKTEFMNSPITKTANAGAGLAKKAIGKIKNRNAGEGGRGDFTADDFVDREEGSGDDVATAPTRATSSAEMTSLASMLSGSGRTINLNFAPASMGRRNKGEGVPLPPVTPQDDADDSSSSSSHSSVMNGSGGFGYGGDEGSSRPTHGSGTAYFGGGGSSRGGVAYFDASQLVDPNMNIDELKSYWDGLKKQEQAQLKAAKDLMKEARAEYTDEDKAEHARVKKERVELSDSFSSEPTAENFVAFSKVADRDDELTAKQRRSQELREQAKEQREQYNNTKAEREAYQAAIGRKVAAGTVTSEQLFALSEDQRDKSINPDLTNDEIAQKEQEYTDKAEESKKRKSKAEEDYQLNVEVQKEQEERLRASQDAIADHKKTIAELNMRIDELKAKKNDPNATEEDKANAEKLIGIAQATIGQERQYINGEILKAQEAKKAIGESKNAQQDALYEKSSADKDLNANTEEALKYAMEKERRENLEKNATMGDLEALKAEINKRADAEKTGVLIDETRKGLDAIAGQVDKKADIFSVDRNADVTKQAIEQLNQEKADSKAVADKLKEKADASKVASALNSMGAGGDGSGGGAGGSGGSGGKVKKPRKTLDEKKRELINKQLDLEEEEIKPGLFSWAKRAKNSVKRTKLRLQIGAISTAQATGDGIQKGVNFAGKWTLGKIQKGADFVKNTSVGRAVTKAGAAVGHVAQVVASAPGQVIDKVKDKVDNSNYMKNERQRIANRQQHYADQHTEQISTAEERVRNNQSRRYYSQEYAEEIERRQNARQQSNGSGSGNRTSTGNGNGNSTSTGNGSGNGNSTSTGNGSGGSGTQNQTNNQTQNQNQAQTQTQNQATTSQTATSQTASTNNPAQNTKLTKGQVAGRVVGGVVGGVAGYAIVASFQNKKMKKKNAQNSADSSTETLTATPTATSESAKPTKAERKAQQATLKAEEEARKEAEREAKRAETERLQREKEEQIVERERQELLDAAKQREREAAIRAQERKDKLRRTKEAHKPLNRNEMAKKSRAQNRKK